ncbi:MAG: TIGR00341 family protein [Gammaproteobacteria bacterium]|nr:TIGR00341 family protein [Gammaproteobacteria bacterium]
MIIYIYSDEVYEFITNNKNLDVWPEDLSYIPFSKIETINLTQVSHVLITGSLKEIKQVMQLAKDNNFTLGLIATPKQKELMHTFNLPKKIEDAASLALIPSEKKLDLLYCNNTIVLQKVVIGNAPPLEHFDTQVRSKSIIQRIILFFLSLLKVKQLKHSKIQITDAKDNIINISTVSIMGIKYKNPTLTAKFLSKKLGVNNGKLLLFILSPSSITQYISYLFQSLTSYITPSKLPGSVGYITSSKILITPEKPLEISVDSSKMSAKVIDLKVYSEALQLSVGDEFWQNNDNTEKDSIKVKHLPSDKESIDYLSHAIPLFTHASQEQYATLFTQLRDEGQISVEFIMLLIFSTMLATFGLFINSSSVVIGAMVLAPLMQPIISFSMGILRQDSSLEMNGIKSIAGGVLIVLMTASLIATFTPIEKVTSEMAGRLSPNILDLFIAIISGIAAAYVKSNNKLLGSLAGVAIAVALVPPLAVAGIGLGWSDWHMFTMAFLLFITNLVGIVLAAAFTFVILGFSPLHLARKGIMTWLLIASLVAIPLYSAFQQMKEDIKIQTTLSNLTLDLGKHKVRLDHIQLIHSKKSNALRCEVTSSGILTKEEKQMLKKSILSHINKDIDLIVSFRYKL